MPYRQAGSAVGCVLLSELFDPAMQHSVGYIHQLSHMRHVGLIRALFIFDNILSFCIVMRHRST